MYNRLTEFDATYEKYCTAASLDTGKSLYVTCFNTSSLINKISCAIDRHEIPAGVFLDLSKAFHTLEHEILLSKLEHYGICDVALKWV